MELLYLYYLVALSLLQISIVTFNSLIIHASERHITHQFPGKCWSSKWEQADAASGLNLSSLHKKEKRNNEDPLQHPGTIGEMAQHAGKYYCYQVVQHVSNTGGGDSEFTE